MKKLVLSGDLPLKVNFGGEKKVKALGAKPYYDGKHFVCWMAPEGEDVMPYKEFWNDEFKEYYYKEINPDAAEKEKEVELPKGQRLSQLLKQVKSALTRGMPEGYWINADVVNITGGVHKYLEIADYDNNGKELAKTRANIFAGNAGIIKRFESETGMKLASGMKVLIKVSVSFHEQFGFSLVVSDIDSRFTLGDMEAKLAKIRKQLLDEGLLNLNKNLREPTDFTRIAVIAPEAAAGLGDFKTTSDKLEAHGLCSFDYYHATFQGKSAVSTISSAIDSVARKIDSGNGYDALIIIRGGGDKAGLYALNEIELAKRVCLLKIPVIVGIGHERDNTVLDEIANLRLPTPSLVISHVANSITHNAMNAKQDLLLIKRLAVSTISDAKLNLDGLSSSIRDESRKQIQSAKTSIDLERQNLFSSSKALIAQARHEIKENASQMVFQDPMKVVDKGYGIVRGPEGKVIGNVSSLNDGDTISVSLRDGDVKAKVLNKKEKSDEND